MEIQVPDDVTEHVRKLFVGCNVTGHSDPLLDSVNQI